jgi:hypothetical protein
MLSSMPDYQKGSIRVIALVSIVALAMAIGGAWWGLTIVPRQKAADAEQTRARIEALVGSKSFLSSPQSKLICDAMGGQWRLGQNTPPAASMTKWIRTPDYCELPASDAGKSCLSSSECESFCAGSLTLGQVFSAQCHPYRNAGPASFGSLLVVENGRPFFRLSIRSETRESADTWEVVGAKIEVQAVDGSKLKVGEVVRATQELRDKPWFPSIGIPGT